MRPATVEAGPATECEEGTSMPLILWLLGVPLGLIIVLWLMGVV
jgi:hypothetical protein